MKRTAKKSSQRKFDKTVYILQGGGSLGAYHVGVLKGLQKQGYFPNWVVGTSIGAIHGAILVGNKPENRISKLKEFWQTISISTPLDFVPHETEDLTRFKNLLSAEYAALFGISGFFTPRMDNPLFKINASPSEISFYDTSPLRDTLKNLIDLNLLNNTDIQFSIGAVEIEVGQIRYFDNHKEKIELEHIMASSALPSGFPAIKADGKLYWDGGIYSNTPLALLMEDKGHHEILCFIIDLFSAYGPLPKNLDEIERRKKEILFGSRYKELIEVYHHIRKLKRSIEMLGKKLPKEVQTSSQIKQWLELGCSGSIDLVRFHRQSSRTDLSTKDYEFSLESAEKYIKAGYEDAIKATSSSPWLKPFASEEIGIRVHEMSKDPFVKSSKGLLCKLNSKY